MCYLVIQEPSHIFHVYGSQDGLEREVYSDEEQYHFSFGWKKAVLGHSDNDKLHLQYEVYDFLYLDQMFKRLFLAIFRGFRRI